MMMEKSDWKNLIRQHLSIQPLTHGLVYTEEIAISPNKNIIISEERKEVLTRSLTQYQSNLIPLILRRTEQYGDDFQYEVIYGVDWCKIAQELKIEKLWAWVFDLDDDQAIAIEVEMLELIDQGEININLIETQQNQNNLPENNPILNQEMIEKAIENKINKMLLNKFNYFFETLEEINKKIDNLNVNLLTSEMVEQILENKINSLSTSKINAEITTNLSDEINVIQYEKMNLTQLKQIAKKRKIPRYSTMKKSELITYLKSNILD